jgi:threonine synthase
MRYVSTRGSAPAVSFAGCLLEGLAPDNGLYLPQAYPVVTAAELAQWRAMDYRALALALFTRFAPDIPEPSLRQIIDRTYTAQIFGHDEITPVTTLEPGLHLLELSNGPTLAFKDIAMQLLAGLFKWALAEKGETLNILGATSGDTGSAAEYAMLGKRGIRVFMLSPAGRMSAFQRAQMYSLNDPAIINLAVEGAFDDCQAIVKAVSGDAAFKQRFRIGTVNSINWARLAAQVVYYFKAYFAVTKSNDQVIDVSVPSGNFGNVCAGHVARQMGLPIRHLIVATNENDVLDEFFRTGTYRPRNTAETKITSSPSMDISKASNFERFVFDLVGRDPQRVKALWGRIDTGGAFDLAESGEFARLPEFGFLSGSSNHQDRLGTIRAVYQRYGREIDPHTADGIGVGLKHRDAQVPLVCLETALPVKFEETMIEALGRPPGRPKGFEGIEALEQHVTTLPADIDWVKRIIETRVGSAAPTRQSA